MAIDKYAQLKKFVQHLVEDAEIVVPEIFEDPNAPVAGNAGVYNITGPKPMTLEERAVTEQQRLKDRLKVEEAKIRFLKNMRVAKSFLECDDIICATLKE